ncbi:MBL fold metallo-hydrolase [Paenibacillus xanthanilyticus]|uniref:MBL fold metallo-hydrolase n=1 Tax=Paenibacillus xanthanilyticus TaxID=1783531 RepID=A0ABV8KE13_9BACL
MKVTQVRNATLIVEYSGKTFLIDPFLAEKGAYPPIPNSVRQDQRNPLFDLPLPIDTIIKADAILVTHLHQDHFDDAAKAALPKDIKLFVQSDADAVEVRKAGFQNVEVLTASTIFEDIQLIITKGEHGRGALVQLAGPVSGVVFKHPSEKTLYVAGDTVWYEGVQEEIAAHRPDVIAVNGGDNQFLQGGSLVMGKEDIYEVHKAAPEATIIATHMEAVNHWTLSRAELRDFIAEKGMTSRVLVPEDGESYVF